MTVTGSTANLREECLALLEVVGCGVTGCRNSQSAMPDHEVLILRIGHLGIQLFTGQIGIDILLQVACMPLGMSLRRIHAIDVVRKTSLHLRILRRLRGIVSASEVEVVVATV